MPSICVDCRTRFPEPAGAAGVRGEPVERQGYKMYPLACPECGGRIKDTAALGLE